MNKCTGKSANGSSCPQSGSCKAFLEGDASVTMQAPFLFENNQFKCNSYVMMTEQNLGGSTLGNDQMLKS